MKVLLVEAYIEPMSVTWVTQIWVKARKRKFFPTKSENGNAPIHEDTCYGISQEPDGGLDVLATEINKQFQLSKLAKIIAPTFQFMLEERWSKRIPEHRTRRQFNKKGFFDSISRTPERFRGQGQASNYFNDQRIEIPTNGLR